MLLICNLERVHGDVTHEYKEHNCAIKKKEGGKIITVIELMYNEESWYMRE